VAAVAEPVTRSAAIGVLLVVVLVGAWAFYSTFLDT
jgi:hypothetical protein